MLRWMLFDYIGVFIWVVTFITGGWAIAELFGLRLDENSDRSVQIFEVILFAFFVIAVVSIMRANSSRQKQLEQQRARAEEVTTAD